MIGNLQLHITSLLSLSFAVSVALVLAMLAFWSSRNHFQPALDMVIGNIGLAMLSFALLFLIIDSREIPFLALFSFAVAVFFTYRAISGVYGVRLKPTSDLMVLGLAILLNITFTIIPRYSFRQIIFALYVGHFYGKALRIILGQTHSNRTKGDVFIISYLFLYAFMFILRGGYYVFHLVHESYFISEKLNSVYVFFTTFLFLLGNAGFFIVATVKADREKNRALEEALDQKEFAEHLVSIISHNLNSNLATINQAVDLMKFSDQDSNKIPEVEIIERTVLQTKNIVTDLVYWGRTRAGKTPKSNSFVSVPSLLWQVSEDISQLILVKDIELTFSEKEENIHLLADSMAARVVLRNLLTNMLIFIPRGSRVSIEVNTEEDDVNITVNSEGRGLPEAITESLQHAANTNKETGTGLLIVSTICKSYDWALSLKTEGDIKAAVTVKFPRYKTQ